MRRATWFLVILGMLAAGCQWPWSDAVTQPVPGAEDNNRDPQWVSQHTPRAGVAIVFVHGIFGDTLGTWTASPSTSFFQLLNSDPTLGAPVDLFAFGYTSKMLTAGSFTIDEAAKRLRERLEYNGVLEYPSVVFVAHSMGGLVVLRTLLTYRDLMPHVPLIALYATPQEGAQIADIARHISPNPALRQMIPGDDNQYLEALDNDWKEATRDHPIPVVCAYEKLDTYKIKIVPRGSATRYCTEPSSAIDADHISITKPDRAGHDSIVLLVNALNRYVTGQQASAKMELPDFTRDAGGWLYTLNSDYGKQHARLVNAGRLPLRYTIAELSDPGLYVWPEDTPHVVAGAKEENLGFALAREAKQTDYSFVLRADGAPDQRVRVHVPDLPKALQQQAAVTGSVLSEISTWLADPAEHGKLAKADAGDEGVADAVTEHARQAVARIMPDAPRSVQWVVTADALNSANWTTLAVNALRQAERASGTVTRLPSVARTAAWVAASSGETHLFANAPSPTVPDTWKLTVGGGLAAGVDVATAAELATRCQGIPALAGPCLSLKGDVAQKRGDDAVATAAFQDSARVRMTPAISERLRQQTARSTVVPGPATHKPDAVATVILNKDAVVTVPPAARAEVPVPVR